ncbi:hypothetical protein L6304_05260 [bacterium]|nr:hypothetical protein [bacterium]
MEVQVLSSPPNLSGWELSRAPTFCRGRPHHPEPFAYGSGYLGEVSRPSGVLVPRPRRGRGKAKPRGDSEGLPYNRQWD